MSLAQQLGGASRIYGELLKFGINTSQATVAKDRVRQRKPPSPTWRTFLNHHPGDFVSVDFFTEPTMSFHGRFVFVVLAPPRWRHVPFNVTAHPTAPWTAQQRFQAFPWDTASRDLIRDRDAVYGEYFRQRIKEIGICEVLTAPGSRW